LLHGRRSAEAVAERKKAALEAKLARANLDYLTKLLRLIQ
jgi:hypothetical protein